ncbi:MAG TPA: pyridoxamine 5'-phosphate oxidase family protein [Acidimicrobiales bacterium]
MTWKHFSDESPELAHRVKARFAAHEHHVVATLRADGSPRVSGTNVVFLGDDVWLGSMPGAVKATDLARDPRFALHSAPLDIQLVEGDAKLAGTAHRLTETHEVEHWFDLLEEATGQRPSGGGDVFRLTITEASIVTVDGDELEISSWSPSDGTRVRRRR